MIVVPLTETLTHDPLVQATIAVCAERGVAVCLVGGAVRDLLLQRSIHDWDFVVEHDALSLARATANRLGGAFFPLDEERDTGRIVMHDSRGVRTFVDLAVRRGPDWQADLEARDLTVNAMAVLLGTPNVSPTSPVLLDPFGGQADLEARLIRAVTERSFRDDPARTMRAVRLAGELRFQLEPQTAEWIRRDAHMLRHVSAERVRDELAKLLAQPDAFSGIRQMDNLGLLEQVLPEATALRGVDQSLPHHWPVFEHTLYVLAALEHMVANSLPQTLQPYRAGEDGGLSTQAFVWHDVAQTLADKHDRLAAHLFQPLGDDRPALVSLKLATLLHDCAKPETKTLDEDGRTHFYGHDDAGAPIAAERARMLRFNNVEVGRVRTIIANHMRPQQLADAESGVTRRAAYRYFRDTREAGVDVILLALADHIATHGPDVKADRWGRRIQAARTLLAEYWTRLAKDVAPPPLVSGNDLMAELGLPQGPRVGELIEAIREAQATGQVTTRQEALELARRAL